MFQREKLSRAERKERLAADVARRKARLQKQRQEAKQQRREALSSLNAEGLAEHAQLREERKQARRQEKAERKAAGEDIGWSQKTSRVVAAGLGGVAAVLSFSAIYQSGVIDDRSAQYTRELSEITEDIAEIEAEATAFSEQGRQEMTAQLDTIMRDARQMAEVVAEEQTAYQQLYYDALSSDAEMVMPAEDDTAEHRRVFESYFADNALIVDDDHVHEPSIAGPYAATRIDPRWPWYLRQEVEGGPVAEDTTYGWEFYSAHPAAGSTDRVDVVWVNRDTEDDTILAWAEGVYSAEDSAFTRLAVGRTSYGEPVPAEDPLAEIDLEAEIEDHTPAPYAPQERDESGANTLDLDEILERLDEHGQ